MGLFPGRADFFKAGSWNLRCQECGMKIKVEETKKRWDGLWVCRFCWEIRHPQDFLRGIPDKQGVPFSTSNVPPIFVGSVSTPMSKPRMIGSFLIGSKTIG